MPIQRITRRTPLRKSLSDLPSSTFFSMAAPSSSFSLMSSLATRKSCFRTTFLALFVICFLSAYIFVFQQRALQAPLGLKRPEPVADQIEKALETIRTSTNAATLRKTYTNQPQLRLDTTQELAAVSSFLASLPQNVIPSFVDPSSPIDPQLVVDFDPQSPRVSDEIQNMIDDVWTRHPVFLYSKLYSPVSREIKAILAGLHLHPAPMIMDVDVREDSTVLEPLLERVLSTDDLPILLIAGHYVGPISNIRSLHESGELKEMIKAAGAVIDGAKRKHKKS
ncbi:uncharacterized protein BT62DRAFT_932109 [Guyanagaster necrorhizus]|uniref:Glutaredoxin-like protein n=1 Tax=Guyanagaster necrorhizus TaxID=856835 RepID=A0A9P7VVJ3_9AGAR|nr:uncharacterized protein BT62DRAFT_932109 [Guyanagaster necrorhizus MCA 3950]KAG7446666.1 hypothetical protein BT62DRAFT_932109 [Guyanagaster necrorhizus MCA 3950]